MDRNNDFSRLRTVQTFKDWGFIALQAEMFFVALSPALAIGSLLVGVICWLIGWRMDREHTLVHNPMDKPLLLFMAVAGLSILASPDKLFSLYNYTCLLGVYALSYLLVGQLVETEEQIKKIVRAMGTAAILVVLYGFFQYAFGIDTADMKWVDGEAFPELKKRVFSTWQNPNILAGYLDEAICIAFAFFVELKEKKNKAQALMLMGMLVACLAMTYARGACLALGVVIVCYGLCRDWRVLVGFAVVGGAVLLADPALMDRLGSVFTRMDTSSEMRLAMWESTVEMILDHPLLGIGWGAYWMVYPLYDFYINNPAVKIVHAHNMFLNYAAETGFVGFLAFFTYFFGSIRLAWKELSRAASDFLRALRLGLGLALVSVAVCGMTDHVAFNIPTSMLLWGLCALIAAASRLTKQDCLEESEAAVIPDELVLPEEIPGELPDGSREGAAGVISDEMPEETSEEKTGETAEEATEAPSGMDIELQNNNKNNE